MLLRPDVAGQYTILATVSTASEGTTNLALTITAGTYMGLYTCELCHSGGLGAPNKVQPWLTTSHASFFAKAIDGLKSSHYNASCIKCHTVGYDANTNAVNGGFDDVAAELGWTFPPVLTNGNWASMQANYPSLANLANIQCENCHGPGSEHVVYNGVLGNTNNISVSLGAGTCAQCHDNPPNDTKVAEWAISGHAVTTTDPSGPGRESCVGCHTSPGFIGRIQGAPTTNTTYAAINCQTCHDSHGETVPATNSPNPYLIRTLAAVPLMDGTVVTNAGKGALCMQCHHSRQNAATYASTARGSTYFGPHEGPQADMLEGVNGFTYGQAIPSSAHGKVVSDACVTCHMQKVPSSDPAFLHAGGHTFKVMCDPDGDGVTENLVGACQQCHGSQFTTTSGWNVPVEDYDGDGVIEGVQDEVQNLLNKLSTLLPPVGTPKSDISIDATWTRPQLEAGYNYRFVQKDGSLGVHNTAYAVGLMKASIANLTGDANNDGLPDAWQIQYFGSINSPNAAPTAAPAGDGLPNWLKYSLGINPTVPGIALTNGVIWANVTALDGATNTIHIYTAAEVSFDTEVGKTYQIQGVSSLSAGWQNIGSPIQGTGASISYLTPTRQGVQQFFRVVHSP